MPGGGNNLEVAGACERAGLRFVLVHGETAAAIMAGVDGELTGAPGACVVTRGPGAASAVNGAAQALLDRQPMLLISDGIPVSHQRIDQDALLAHVTKWSASLGLDGAAETVAAAVEPYAFGIVARPRPTPPVRPRPSSACFPFRSP